MGAKNAKSNQPVFVVAMDTGNGGNKVVSDTVKRDHYEAVLGRYTAPQAITRMSRRSAVTTYQVDSDNQDWVVGYKDVQSYKLDPIPVYSRNSLSRYSQPLFATYAKIGLARAVEGAEDMLPILLVTSTPAYDFHKPEVRTQLSKVFHDLHKVHVNGERKVINVVQYEPMSETEAILYDIYFDENGEVADERITEEDVLIINCGYGTTDLSHYSNMEYIRMPKETLHTSFLDVYTRCSLWLTKVLGKQIDVQEVARQLASQQQQKVKTFNFVGKDVEGFHSIYDQAIQGVFEDLRTELNGIIDDPDLFHRIVVVGGPIEEWGHLFKDWNASRVQIPADPQFSPARGMYKFGKYFVIPSLAQGEIASTKD
ncbi:hypothetical protein RB620_24830 [Paenibacillus sp. LHD-117]|uniref:ParM/StbA family protein n=1 Tax=Paenibacillus sp. LHD-117 TaxID=3071412 RepID=UPI0027DEE16C|nr:hypothetical protein [Paenibacillus sp. LHD-117]MDQ6422663.1 hypothetical protein [Paenibacillus sp. LHD-117]